ncbi:unnamed protein product [Macrosiphum euphorbiae]|uniref:MADF domain-containing protein n=1 Tax=Macrosiphum euphorbiae TaxID=13131 RepID=A0AAV0X695_9HEMI|nr:unnamed protein product [Macrosiphum euphorbiae]
MCKTRWNNIRDNYRKSIKKTTSGQAAKKVKKYKFDDQLQFLKPHLQERDTLGNIEDVVDNEDNVDIFNDDVDENENENDNENAAVQIDEIINDIDGEQLQNVEQTRSSKPVRKSIQKRSIIKTPDSASTTLMKYIMQKKENNMFNVTQNNPVDAFLAGLSPTLKTFTPYYLNLVKTKIFSIVQECEMKMILDEEQKKNSHTVPYFTVPSPTYYQQLNPTIIPNAAQKNQYVQEPRYMTSTSHYLPSPPSPQFTQKNAQNHAYVQVPTNTLSPNTSYCSSAPPSPADLCQNISLNATQNLTHNNNIQAQNNQYAQEPRNMTSRSHYLSSTPSPQFTQKNSQNHAYVQVPTNTLSPNISYCSSAPPSPADLSQNMSLNASQNLAHNIQGPTDQIFTNDLIL